MFINTFRGSVLAAFVAAGLGMATTAHAQSIDVGEIDTTIFDENGFTANWYLSAGIYGGFGRDITIFGPPNDFDWGEAFAHPGLHVEYASEGAGTFYGDVSAIYTVTFGDGDPAFFTADGTDGISLENAYGGWRSGNLFDVEDLIDVSFGQQSFQIGNGFLVYDGTFDFNKGAYWLAPRTSFEYAGVLRYNQEPVRGDIFYLNANDSQDQTELIGVNVEYWDEDINADYATLGATFMAVLDSDDFVFFREDMKVIDVRAAGSPFASLPDLHIGAEFVYQWGENTACACDIEAYAGYGEIAYTFSDAPWSPTLMYRYSLYSGDDPATADWEGFDPLFYGFSDGYGTWYVGEISGEYFLFNTNMRVHQVQLSASPTDELGIGAVWYYITADESTGFPYGVANDNWGHELNLYADWAINDYVSVGALYGILFPGDLITSPGAGFGLPDDPFHLFQAYLLLSL